jgi:hypothetical protein
MRSQQQLQTPTKQALAQLQHGTSPPVSPADEPSTSLCTGKRTAGGGGGDQGGDQEATERLDARIKHPVSAPVAQSGAFLGPKGREVDVSRLDVVRSLLPSFRRARELRSTLIAALGEVDVSRLCAASRQLAAAGDQLHSPVATIMLSSRDCGPLGIVFADHCGACDPLIPPRVLGFEPGRAASTYAHQVPPGSVLIGIQGCSVEGLGAAAALAVLRCNRDVRPLALSFAVRAASATQLPATGLLGVERPEEVQVPPLAGTGGSTEPVSVGPVIIVRLQAAARGWIVRRWLAVLCHAAMVLQRWARGWRARRLREVRAACMPCSSSSRCQSATAPLSA